MNGTLTIEQDQIHAGEIIRINLQSPEDQSFISQLRIFKDLPQENIEAHSFPVREAVGFSHLNNAESNVGIPFQVEIDTLNFAPGLYHFMTLSPNRANVFDEIEILESNNEDLEIVLKDMLQNERSFELYSEEGDLCFQQEFETRFINSLSMGTVYTLAINLNHYKAMINKVNVAFYDPSGTILQYNSLLEIRPFREQFLESKIAFTEGCEGVQVNRGDFIHEIALIRFRTPNHQKYYEYDGQLKFEISAARSNQEECNYENESRLAFIDDTPAAVPIPSFDAYNQMNFPGQEWRYNFPFDKRTARLVRIGSMGKDSGEELQEIADAIEITFQGASKDYFHLSVEGIHQFPLVNDLNRVKVETWYHNVPKTPNKPSLDLANSKEMVLATLLYYSEHDESNFLSDMQSIYPKASNGEDITIYLFDGPGDFIGKAMGANGLRVKNARLYPDFAYYEGEGNERTYHFDLSEFANGEYDLDSYFQRQTDERSPITIVGTIVHELGHVGWIERVGVSTGDLEDAYQPFRSDFVAIDKSIGYYTRSEVMSYGRDRNTLENISYGDAFLERILEAYQQPEVEVEFLSHVADENDSITAQAGEEIVLRLTGIAASGLKMLWYFNQHGPVRLANGTPEKFGMFKYGSEERRVKNDTHEIRFRLNEAGIYIYRMRTRDRLYPIAWQKHQSLLGEFSINIL